MIYYHNPRCSKSREGLAIVEASGIKFEIKEYLKTGLTKKEIDFLVTSIQQPILQILRTKEAGFKELGLSLDQLNSKKISEILHKHPELLERPILSSKTKSVIGRPVELLKELLS